MDVHTDKWTDKQTHEWMIRLIAVYSPKIFVLYCKIKMHISSNLKTLQTIYVTQKFNSVLARAEARVITIPVNNSLPRKFFLLQSIDLG